MGLRDSELGFFSVLPAYAGMIPTCEAVGKQEIRAPRIRGDDPFFDDLVEHEELCSPHTRG